jgi:hypothetical protein
MSARTTDITTILDAGKAVATPPNVIRAFEQTGLHSAWDREGGGLAMSVDRAPARELKRERTVDETEE